MVEEVSTALVIGGKGFLGSNLVRALENLGHPFISYDIGQDEEALKHDSYDIVYFCAGNSRTYLSRKDPAFCLERNALDLLHYIRAISYRKFVFISSVAVYPQAVGERKENDAIDYEHISIYGIHKLLGEKYVREFCDNWLIVRPTGFFGNGLQKNLLYDLMHDSRDVYLQHGSYIDYMPVDWFTESLIKLGDIVDNAVINMGSGYPMSMDDLLRIRTLDYRFYNERMQDDRGISLDKFSRYVENTFSYEYLYTKICNFITTGK